MIYPGAKIKKGGYLLSFIMALLVGLYFRLYPLIHHIPHETQEKATSLVLARIRQHALHTISTQNPSLNQFDKNILVKKLFDKTLREESEQVKKSILKLSKQLGKSLPDHPAPYLLASDSYYYYGLTKQILRTGTIADTIKGSKYLNKYMLAPEGHWEPLNLHPVLGYLIYKAVRVIDKKADLMYGVSFTPLLITVLSLVLFFLICDIFRYPKTATFIGAIYLLLAPIFVRRSAFGWYDNDPYNILFPFLILAFFFSGIKHANNARKGALFAILCNIALTAYALFWQGWVYLFGIILLSSITIFLYNHFVLKEIKSSKALLIYLSIANLGNFVGIGAVFGISEFFVLFEEGWRALKNFLSPQLTLWPDLFMTVGELKKASLKKIIELTGGFIFFICAAIGLLKYASNIVRPKEGQNILPSIVVIFFLFFSMMITFGAERFALLTLIPLSILFPCGMVTVHRMMRDFMARTLAPQFHPQKVVAGMTFLAICGMLIFPIIKTHHIMMAWRPIFNDTWQVVLNKIKQDTPPESIINTWWPPGHFITSMAQRRVTFDGATINRPQAYWLANVLLSQDEREAAGLLRILNNSANQACDYLTDQHIPLSTAVQMIRQVALLNRIQSAALLETRFSEIHIRRLLSLTHKRPPPSYLLIYNEIVQKNLELGFIKMWNFRKIERLNEDPEALKRIPAKNTKQYVNFLWDLVGGPLKYSGVLGQIATTGDRVIFDENVQVNLADMTCQVNSAKFGKGTPFSLFYLKDGEIIEQKDKHADLPFSVVLFKNLNRYNVVLMDTALARSLLVKLFFFEGKGLRYFELFTESVDITGRTHIYVFKVDWKKFLEDIQEGDDVDF